MHAMTASNPVTKLLGTVFHVAAWLGAGLLALSMGAMLMLGLAVAGLWAMLTGRKAWWTQLRQAHTQARQAQGMWRGRAASSGHAAQATQADANPFGQTEHANQSPEAVDPRGQRTPLAERRFGRAGRLGVTDVQAREAH